MELVEGRVARYWNMKPWEFRSLGKEEKAELYAHYSVDIEVEHYYNSENARRVNQPTNGLPVGAAGG